MVGSQNEGRGNCVVASQARECLVLWGGGAGTCTPSTEHAFAHPTTHM